MAGTSSSTCQQPETLDRRLRPAAAAGQIWDPGAAIMPGGLVFGHRVQMKLLDRKLFQARSRKALALQNAADAKPRIETNRQETLKYIEEATKRRDAVQASWADVRQMFESGQRMKKTRDKALIRKVINRILQRVAAQCLQEWSGFTRRRMRQKFLHEFQGKMEDLEFENQSLLKAMSRCKEKMRFAGDADAAAKAADLLQMMGHRSVRMWFRMWKEWALDRIRTAEARQIAKLERQIEATEAECKLLARKTQREANFHARNRMEMGALQQRDASRHAQHLVKWRQHPPYCYSCPACKVLAGLRTR